MSNPKPEMMLWLSDARGVYIPRDFANSFEDRANHVDGVTEEQWAILEQGPDAEWYWDTWSDVLDSAVVTDEGGAKFSLHQDGDLWLIPHGMVWNDETEGFAWPSEEG